MDIQKINTTMHAMIEQIRFWVADHTDNFRFGFLSFLTSAFASVCGYFAPLGEILIVLFACIMADLVTGIWAARVKGLGIKSKRLKKTAVKIGLYFGVIMLIYSIDHAFNILNLSSYTAWLIVGFEAYSVLENTMVITDNPVFRVLRKFMNDKIKDTTGVDIEKEQKENNYCNEDKQQGS